MFRLVVSAKDVPPGRRLYTDDPQVSWQTNSPLRLPTKEAPSSSSTTSTTNTETAVTRHALHKIRDDITGSVHLFHYSKNSTISSVNSQMLCILAVPTSVGDEDFWRFVETSCTALSTRCEPSTGIESTRIIRDPCWAQGRSMVVIHFSTQDATESFFMGHNNRRFTASAPEECQVVYLHSVDFVPPNSALTQSGGVAEEEEEKEEEDEEEEERTSGMCEAELPTCPVCLERLDPEASGLLCTPCNKSFYMDTRTEWTDNTCAVCSCIAAHAQKGVHITCQRCGTDRDLWVCLVCGHVGCGRALGSHALEHFRTTKHTFCYDLDNKRIWDYTQDKYVHRIPFQDYDDDNDNNSAIGNNSSSSSGSGSGGSYGSRRGTSLNGSKAVGAEVCFSQMFERQKQRLEGEMHKTQEGLDKERDGADARIRELEALVRAAEAELRACTEEGAVLEQTVAANTKKRVAANGTIKTLREKAESLRREEEARRGVEEGLAKERDSEEGRYALRERELKAECARMVEQREELKAQIRDLSVHMKMQKAAHDNPALRSGEVITLAPPLRKQQQRSGGGGGSSSSKGGKRKGRK